MAHGSRLMAHDSWLMAHDSWLMAHGSWLMANKKFAAGSPRPRALAANFSMRRFENDFRFFLEYLDVLVSPKIKNNNIGLGAQGHVRKSRNHENEGFEGYPIMTSKSY